jgi:very-long-chain (3R)-3-hydroxyacyl-CoA dehydratase
MFVSTPAAVSGTAVLTALGYPGWMCASWCHRYSGFIVLYPIGVASELTMAWLALPIIKNTQMWSVELPNAWNFGFSYYITCILVMLSYIPGV